MPPRAAQHPEQQAHSRIPMSVPDWRQPQGLRGRSGFKPTCRAEFAAWTASGRAGLGAGGPRQGLAGLRDDAPSERSATKRRRYGGSRGACGAWPRCRWAAAGPGLDPRRRAKRTISNQAPAVWRPPRGLRGLAAVPEGGGRAWPGFEIDHSEPQARVWRSRGRAAAHRHTQRPNPTRQATRRPENPWCHKPRPKVRTPRSTPDSGRPGGHRGDRGR